MAKAALFNSSTSLSRVLSHTKSFKAPGLGCVTGLQTSSYRDRDAGLLDRAKKSANQIFLSQCGITWIRRPNVFNAFQIGRS